jgi:hypothetical protein
VIGATKALLKKNIGGLICKYEQADPGTAEPSAPACQCPPARAALLTMAASRTARRRVRTHKWETFIYGATSGRDVSLPDIKYAPIGSGGSNKIHGALGFNSRH